MSQVLRLEYASTKAEREEAESLSLRHQLGGGSKWLTWFVLLAMVCAMLGLFYVQIVREVSPKHRPYVVAGLLVLIAAIFLFKRRVRKKGHSIASQLEISEKEVAILSPESRVAFPWSAFSKCLESPNIFVLVDRPKTTLLIVPKRVFPSESWQTWFRALANHQPSSGEMPVMERPVLTGNLSADRAVLNFRLEYRDYLDRAVASYSTWAVVFLVTGLIIGTTIYSAAHPPPNAVYSATQVFLMFEIPFLLVMVAMVVVISATYAWFAHRKALTHQDVALSEAGIEFAGRDGSGFLPWTTYPCYKETRWSFIVWNGRQSWFMLPKREFEPPNGVNRCRELLAQHLRRSRWFFG